MGSSDSSPANTTISVSSTSSPSTYSSTALINTEHRSTNNLSDYGGISTSGQSSLTYLASSEEAQSASLVLENPSAKFNPNCVFESESWGKHAVAGIGDEISNLLKNIVGSGGLSIPGGIAAFANAPSAIWPSVVVIWIMGITNAYSFSLLGRICAITKSHSYSMAWERTVGRRYGSKYQLFVDGVVFGKAILGTWSFSIIIASTCTPLYRWILENYDHHGNNGSEFHSPTSVLVVITLFVLLPMCLSQRLASLSILSAIGTLGTLVTISTMILRHFDGSYLDGGKFYDDLSLNQRPSFGTDKGASAFFTSFKSLTLVSILSTGYIAHYNAPKYYDELKNHTTGRFNIVVTFGFLFAAITYTVVSTMGFLTFGEHSMGFVLDNYSYRDPLATIARFGVAVSVIFAYPLLFHGGRDGLVSLLQTLSNTTTIGSATISSTPTTSDTRIRPPTQTESNIVTVLLLSTVTALAIYVNDLTFVLSFSGATMSSLIIYIFPPFMFSALVKNCCCYVSEDTDREVRLGYAMMIIGAILGIAGAYVSVERAFF